MIKVSVFYPNTEGKKFDMAYYCNKHIPMVQQKLGAACKRVNVEQGLSGGQPGSKATYIAMGHLYFDSVEAFQTAFGPHAEEIETSGVVSQHLTFIVILPSLSPQ